MESKSEATVPMRRAFTLLELLIVLALVVVLVSVVTLTLRAPLSNQRLRAGSDVLRTALGRTRNQAIRFGRPYLLSVQSGSDSLAISPWLGDGGSGSAAPANSDTATAAPSPPVGEEGSGSGAEQSVPLPEGILVHSANIATQGVGEPPPDGQAQQILFLPDGTAVDAVVTLRNESGDELSVYLHGVTAGSRVGPIASSNGVVR